MKIQITESDFMNILNILTSCSDFNYRVCLISQISMIWNEVTLLIWIFMRRQVIIKTSWEVNSEMTSWLIWICMTAFHEYPKMTNSKTSLNEYSNYHDVISWIFKLHMTSGYLNVIWILINMKWRHWSFEYSWSDVIGHLNIRGFIIHERRHWSFEYS